MKNISVKNLLLPLVGAAVVLGVWALSSATWAPALPSPVQTWEASKLYIVDPLRVAKGYALALVLGVPFGFMLGISKTFAKAFDPLAQVLRPVSPLAWLPLGLVLFQKSDPAATFTIAMCSMWPTVLNTSLGVKSIPAEYMNVGRVLGLSPTRRFFKILLPAALPYMWTGFRLSLGIAWLVIVAAEMLTGAPGVGGFLWQEYNALIYEHILLCILAIGLVGYALDRLMSMAELRLGGT
jgi:nitrate/nitrite transport system permease protein